MTGLKKGCGGKETGEGRGKKTRSARGDAGQEERTGRRQGRRRGVSKTRPTKLFKKKKKRLEYGPGGGKVNG